MLTKIGSSSNRLLNPQVGNEITTDEYGMLVGKIRFRYNDAGTAYQKRPKKGDPYAGSLAEYRGMMADQSGAIRTTGDCAFIDVTYLGIDPNFAILPEESAEIEYRDLSFAIDNVGTITFDPIPIPHPILSYKFVATKRQGKRGTYSKPPHAPDIPDYVHRVHGIQAATSGIELFDVVFKASAAGWLCLKDDPTPVCGGKLFVIEQIWKRTYYFSSFANAGN
jgi:hypothetical protein